MTFSFPISYTQYILTNSLLRVQFKFKPMGHEAVVKQTNKTCFVGKEMLLSKVSPKSIHYMPTIYRLGTAGPLCTSTAFITNFCLHFP
jgi:hypothetical protein